MPGSQFSTMGKKELLKREKLLKITIYCCIFYIIIIMSDRYRLIITKNEFNGLTVAFIAMGIITIVAPKSLKEAQKKLNQEINKKRQPLLLINLHSTQ
jgi:hypothetical protein